ncbi:MAG: SPOR domain-containing protein, partial [Desulfuromonadales bacterium]|nr:SPOR domain-containing protein [Desulfuromonadales bacterium]
MSEIPVMSRTQRRFERRQILLMTILVLAVTVASFFLGVMVGERGSLFGSRVEAPRLPMAQIAPPPLPSSAPAGAQKLTFYDDLPKGNSAPLGSGINMPKGGYLPPPPPAAVAPAAAVAPPVAEAAVVKEPAARAPAAAPAPAREVAAPKTSAGGSFVVQIAATKDQAEARRLVDKLKGKGFATSSERADLGAKGIWYRVVVGPYGDKATADKAASQLKQQKFSA